MRRAVDGLDLGASIVTGFGGGNPLAMVALQLNLGIDVMRTDCPIYGLNGQPLSPEVDQRAEALFNELMDGPTQRHARWHAVRLDAHGAP